MTLGKPKPAPFTCAICGADIATEAESTLVPLGKGRAMVRVCETCDVEPARAKDGPRLGYQISEGASSANIKKAANVALEKMGAPKASLLRRGIMIGKASHGGLSGKTPGWIVVRVHNKGQDTREALASLRDKPWYRELRILGCVERWHLFERPDPKVAASSRARSENPLASLEQYRTKKP